MRGFLRTFFSVIEDMSLKAKQKKTLYYNLFKVGPTLCLAYNKVGTREEKTHSCHLTAVGKKLTLLKIIM